MKIPIDQMVPPPIRETKKEVEPEIQESERFVHGFKELNQMYKKLKGQFIAYLLFTYKEINKGDIIQFEGIEYEIISLTYEEKELINVELKEKK